MFCVGNGSADSLRPIENFSISQSESGHKISLDFADVGGEFILAISKLHQNIRIDIPITDAGKGKFETVVPAIMERSLHLGNETYSIFLIDKTGAKRSSTLIYKY